MAATLSAGPHSGPGFLKETAPKRRAASVAKGCIPKRGNSIPGPILNLFKLDLGESSCCS